MRHRSLPPGASLRPAKVYENGFENEAFLKAVGAAKVGVTVMSLSSAQQESVARGIRPLTLPCSLVSNQVLLMWGA